ncbi:MAG: ribose 5-phosphate isomerase B [Alphaproteobacteria bacterium]|nr:ribose 5-phosphate isomerase B [Alphaproteobacteria bacterium]
MKTIAMASDHAGYALKEALRADLEADRTDIRVVDLGTHDAKESVDYPDFGNAMARAIESGEVDAGVVVCGTGIGISIAANRSPAVRAALCHDATTARLAREHNDANVLALGARVIGPETARECVKVFLETSFAGGRHVRRVAKLTPSP